jgi:hypothetical protein
MKIFEKDDQELLLEEKSFFSKKIQRRNFLQYAGASAAGVALVAAGCKKNNNFSRGVDLGSGDIGILNYAYSLEQLEAAFYTQVALTPYANITSTESAYMTSIRDHEVVHREFFKAALGPNAIIGLQVDFSSINFTSRDSVLGAAKAFEDLGVSAYNGAGYLIKSAEYLTLAGKIVSVEGRHAALIRDLISPGSFVGPDVIDANALDTSRTPIEVLSIAKKYIVTEINASNLPS